MKKQIISIRFFIIACALLASILPGRANLVMNGSFVWAAIWKSDKSGDMNIGWW